MEKSIIIMRDAYKKNSDGSWTCIKSTDIKDTELGYAHRVNPGMVFKKSKTQWGINVVEQLEQADLQ